MASGRDFIFWQGMVQTRLRVDAQRFADGKDRDESQSGEM
jgi:hypothetical protein